MAILQNDFQRQLFQKFDIINTKIAKLSTPAIIKAGLTPQSATILYLVHEFDNCNLSFIQKKLGWNQGNLSSLCKKIEKQGFLLRERQKEDERVVTLKLTQMGYQALDALNCEFDEMEAILNTIPQEKKALVLNGLNALYEIIGIIEQGGKEEHA